MQGFCSPRLLIEGLAMPLTNPAGRVYVFMRGVLAASQNKAVAGHTLRVAVSTFLGEDDSRSTRVVNVCVSIRDQVEEITGLMRSPELVNLPGYDSYLEHVDEVLNVAKDLMFHENPCQIVMNNIPKTGWNALRFADDALDRIAHHHDVLPTEEEQAELLDQIQDLIQSVRASRTMTPADQERLIDTLRQAERDLEDIERYGFIRVQEDLAAATYFAMAKRDGGISEKMASLAYRFVGAISMSEPVIGALGGAVGTQIKALTSGK